MNNPLIYNDPSGEFVFAIFAALPVFWGTVATAAVIGAAVGAGMYLVQAAITGNFSLKGFGQSILMGALTGAISGGISHVFSVSSFWGAVGVGALTGGVNGGVTALITGENFLKSVFKGAVIGGAVGAISYTIKFYSKGGGKEAGANFWNGKAKLDLSKGFGAHGVDAKALGSEIKATYVGEYRGVKVYESSVGFGEGAQSGGITLPPDKIVVGKGAYKLREILGSKGTYDLFSHEYGHILQAKKVGLNGFYGVIAPESLYSAMVNTYDGHNLYWTETWANQLSYDYFKKRNIFFNIQMLPTKPISEEGINKFMQYIRNGGKMEIPKYWNKTP